MTIAVRKAREAYDCENPCRAKTDGTVCELLFNDMVGNLACEDQRYFLDQMATGIGSIHPARVPR